jgi:hypothetical protein
MRVGDLAPTISATLFPERTLGDRPARDFCGIVVAMDDDKESTSKRLRREAEELRETAVDLMEHAALLINKSIEVDKQIERNNKRSTRKK